MSETHRWRRKYMESEHQKRKSNLKWRRNEFEMRRTISDLRETIELLHAEIRREQNEIQSQKRAIYIMKETMEKHNIPVYPAMMKLRLCDSTDEETCPLAMESINKCPPPFEGCCTALNALKPRQKCGELQCGHRFNAVWLMFHFVKNSTSRCPGAESARNGFNSTKEWYRSV